MAKSLTPFEEAITRLDALHNALNTVPSRIEQIVQTIQLWMSEGSCDEEDTLEVFESIDLYLNRVQLIREDYQSKLEELHRMLEPKVVSRIAQRAAQAKERTLAGRQSGYGTKEKLDVKGTFDWWSKQYEG